MKIIKSTQFAVHDSCTALSEQRRNQWYRENLKGIT